MKKGLKLIQLMMLAVFYTSFVFAQSQHDHGDNAKAEPHKAFTLIKGLVGEWKGTVKWTGARTGEGEMDARYYLTGNGSAVVEDLLSNNQPVMTSVYHLDGADLRATHFCAAGNQPRLRAEPFDEKERSVNFRFVDITNLSRPGVPHVEGLELRFVDPDQLALMFTFTSAGALSYEHITLRRVRIE